MNMTEALQMTGLCGAVGPEPALFCALERAHEPPCEYAWEIEPSATAAAGSEADTAVGGAPDATAALDEAGDATPKPDRGAADTIPSHSPLAASTLDELLRAPAGDTFVAYAKEILGIDADAAVALGDFSEADGRQVLAALGDAWDALRPRLPVTVKAYARAWYEASSPHVRKPRPTAEDLREAVQIEAAL